ncbi:MAG TPA: NAD-binding protein [Thermoanaerobaculia bacterium]|nr:NAD-binding protein [Thermoanaerobaculia bacterium]
MKFLPSQLAYLFGETQSRRNLKALFKYLLFLAAVVVVYALVFHLIMTEVEGQDHSWVTGIYWTLTVMSTLGFGDITFESDVGRLFSIVVLLTGIVLLLIVLPFAFIRFFYAPWLEAQIRFRAPRQVPPGTVGHVIVSHFEAVARGLVRKLDLMAIPYFVIEPDPARAAELHNEGVRVVTGHLDAPATYEALRARDARAVLACGDDPTNTNITLTVRELGDSIPVIAVAEDEESVDLLELAGASHVLPLKQRLGEQLAGRVNAGHAAAHAVGRFKDLEIAEFPVHGTPLVGRTIRDTRLRQTLGLNIVGVWQRGRLLAAHPDLTLTASSVPVVVGTADQIAELDTLLVIYDTNYNPAVVIGGGKVGVAAVRALRKKGMAVHLVEKNERLRSRLAGVPDRLFLGDAADRAVIMEAGLAEAPSVLLTTNDDAINIYLAVYCRRLNPALRIVSRITHERNLEAIHRAGADFALSYTSLGVESVFALLASREMVLVGEGVEFFALDIPKSLAGRSLAQTQLGARTGLNVIAVETDEGFTANPPADQPLPLRGKLLALGSSEQRQRFREELG